MIKVFPIHSDYITDSQNRLHNFQDTRFLFSSYLVHANHSLSLSGNDDRECHLNFYRENSFFFFDPMPFYHPNSIHTCRNGDTLATLEHKNHTFLHNFYDQIPVHNNLSLSSNCRIFPNLCILDISTEIMFRLNFHNCLFFCYDFVLFVGIAEFLIFGCRFAALFRNFGLP